MVILSLGERLRESSEDCRRNKEWQELLKMLFIFNCKSAIDPRRNSVFLHTILRQKDITIIC